MEFVQYASAGFKHEESLKYLNTSSECFTDIDHWQYCKLPTDLKSSSQIIFVDLHQRIHRVCKPNWNHNFSGNSIRFTFRLSVDFLQIQRQIKRIKTYPVSKIEVVVTNAVHNHSGGVSKHDSLEFSPCGQSSYLDFKHRTKQI